MMLQRPLFLKIQTHSQYLFLKWSCLEEITPQPTYTRAPPFTEFPWNQTLGKNDQVASIKRFFYLNYTLIFPMNLHCPLWHTAWPISCGKARYHRPALEHRLRQEVSGLPTHCCALKYGRKVVCIYTNRGRWRMLMLCTGKQVFLQRGLENNYQIVWTSLCLKTVTNLYLNAAWACSVF